MRILTRPAALLLLAFATPIPIAAQTPDTIASTADDAPVRYDISFPDAAHHQARIVATWRGVPAGPLRVQMSRSSPGRYALHEFAKNVYAVSATDGAGRALPLTRTDPYGWSVAGHDGTVRITYTLYGDRGDGTYAQIDTTHAHLNMPATILWATGYDDRPIDLTFTPAAPDWTVATQLATTNTPGRYRAANLQYLMDSPTELSRHDVREWQVGDGADRYTIRLAVHHPGTPADVDRFAEQVKALIPQHRALFGEWPRFDHGSYTFIADYMPQASGDGMEHRNSTIVTGTAPLDGSNAAQLGTVAHEFVHAWNVERLRPAELEPFDFTRANPTPSLWFAEGFTQYYGPLLIRRAGLSTTDAWLADMSQTLDYVVNAPARQLAGPMEMSLRAPFADAATSIDPVSPNVFLSYYPYGAVVALALDLSLRRQFPKLTLDDYMRLLWRTHGRTEKPYVTADLRSALAQLTGDAAFAHRFFAQTVEGHALPDMAPLLAQAGLLLRPAHPARGWIGTRAANATPAGEVVLAAAPPPGSPLYGAGADKGDRIVALGTTPLATVADWDAALARLAPGSDVAVRFVPRDGRERQATLRVRPDPTLEVVRAEAAGIPLTAGQRRFRNAWLGGPSADPQETTVRR
ncbi:MULTISPECIES: M61 family metallopeptidase [Sphingomonas]|jgi:predicted metalloprotease with PDZ domain|uniref:M61 family metallopeptidase n=1 Tax=Sphingomonas TaxID=13687 RepID=UPI00083647DF|nr:MULTISPECIES: PDZ domain-containing protein [Sphingomonas]MBY0300959.1 PDZ domain-containing protein [Sphingomonas ginsenosidimutans]